MIHLTTVPLLAAAAKALDADPPPFAAARCGEVVPRRELTATAGRADCPSCLALVAEPSEATVIATWRLAARTLGVSEDTLARRRRARDPERRCYFRDEGELVAWWRSIAQAPVSTSPAPPRRASKRSTTVRGEEGPVDWDQLTRDLTRGPGSGS